MPPAHATSITAAGDISSEPGGHRGDRLTAELIRRWNPRAVLALGDVQYEAGELVNFQQAYDRSWGAFKAKTHPSIGNHEYLGGDGAAGYFYYFGAAAGPRGSELLGRDRPMACCCAELQLRHGARRGMRARVGAMGLAEAGPVRPPDPMHAGVLPRSLPCLNGAAWRQPGAGPPVDSWSPAASTSC